MMVLPSVVPCSYGEQRVGKLVGFPVGGAFWCLAVPCRASTAPEGTVPPCLGRHRGVRGDFGPPTGHGHGKQGPPITSSTAHKNNTASGLLPGGAHPHVVAVGVHHGFRDDSDGKRLFKPLASTSKRLNMFENRQRVCLLDAYFVANTASISTVASTVTTRRKA
jgi:hypothetical protein